MRRVILVLPALAVLTLGACASTSGSGLARKERTVIDTQQVAAINALSLRRGVNVTWVNPPVKRVPSKSGLAD